MTRFPEMQDPAPSKGLRAVEGPQTNPTDLALFAALSRAIDAMAAKKFEGLPPASSAPGQIAINERAEAWRKIANERAALRASEGRGKADH